MKRLTILLSLMLLVQLTFAKKASIQKDVLLFEKGVLLQQLVNEDLRLNDIIDSKDSQKVKKELAEDIKETILEKALGYYQELIDSFPKSKLLFRALNNKGFIELALDENDDAKITFKRILNGNARDSENGGIGSGLMAEPYANYKNRAAKTLANISISDSNYNEALNYLDLTKKYPYRHFCGNEYAEEEIYMSEQYAKCYLGLNNRNKALEYLLPNLIENGLADNSDLVKLTYETLIKDYNKEELKKEYEKAFKSIHVEKIKSENNSYNEYFIIFLDTKIKLSSWRFEFFEGAERQQAIDRIYKQSEFYKLLND